MNVLLADQKVYAGYGQYDEEEDYGGGRGVGRESSAVTVEHILDIADDGVHLGGVEVCAEKGDRVAVRLECADKSGDD